MPIRYDGKVQEALYRNRIDDRGGYHDRVWRVLCSGFFQKHIPEGSTVLDLGAGWCEFINNIRAERKYAMDLNPDTGRLLEKGATFLQHDCCQPWPLDPETLDCVFTSNLFEHLRHKECVEKTLTQAFRCLRKGGLMICIGPNIRYLPGKYWVFWDHHIPISAESICEVLRLKGFRIERCVPKFLPYTMWKGPTYPSWLIRIFLHVPIIWFLFAKQFLVFARKD